MTLRRLTASRNDLRGTSENKQDFKKTAGEERALWEKKKSDAKINRIVSKVLQDCNHDLLNEEDIEMERNMEPRSNQPKKVRRIIGAEDYHQISQRDHTSTRLQLERPKAVKYDSDGNDMRKGRILTEMAHPHLKNDEINLGPTKAARTLNFPLIECLVVGHRATTLHNTAKHVSYMATNVT